MKITYHQSNEVDASSFYKKNDLNKLNCIHKIRNSSKFELNSMADKIISTYYKNYEPKCKYGPGTG